MSFKAMRWFNFGFKVEVLWGAILLALFMLIGGKIASLFGIDLTVFFTGSLLIGAAIILGAALFGGALWIVLGYLYENGLDGIIGWMPTWAKITVMSLLASFTLDLTSSLLTGGSSLALLLLLLPAVLYTLVVSIITVKIFEYLEWDIPLYKTR